MSETATKTTETGGQVHPMVRHSGACGHMFKPGIYCDLPAGHETTHKFYEEVRQTPAEVSFCVWEWDAYRQTLRDPGEFCKIFAYDDSEIDRARVMAEAMSDANKYLPPGTVYEIRENVYPKIGDALGFGKIIVTEEPQRAIAWFWKPLSSEMPAAYRDRGISDDAELFVRSPGDGIGANYLGYNVVARLKADDYA